MVDGRTLIMKGKNKATLVENYRPIACLNFSWKLLTGIFAEKTYLYLSMSKLLLYEQKRAWQRFKGHHGPPLSSCSVQSRNKNRRKAIFNWAAKGLFFLRGGGGYTHSGYHKTLSPTIA